MVNGEVATAMVQYLHDMAVGRRRAGVWPSDGGAVKWHLPTARQTFRDVVAQVAAKARAKLPEAVNGRIESAVKLVLV